MSELDGLDGWMDWWIGKDGLELLLALAKVGKKCQLVGRRRQVR